MSDFNNEAQKILRSQDALNRRVFLGGMAGGLGYAALANLMQPEVARAAAEADAARKAAVRRSRSSATRKTLNPLCCRRMRLRLLHRWWRWRRK